MLYFFRVLIILLKGIIPRFVSVILFPRFRFGRFARFARFGGFVSLFRVLVHAQSFIFDKPQSRCCVTGSVTAGQINKYFLTLANYYIATSFEEEKLS